MGRISPGRGNLTTEAHSVHVGITVEEVISIHLGRGKTPFTGEGLSRVFKNSQPPSRRIRPLGPSICTKEYAQRHRIGTHRDEEASQAGAYLDCSKAVCVCVSA